MSDYDRMMMHLEDYNICGSLQDETKKKYEKMNMIAHHLYHFDTTNNTPQKCEQIRRDNKYKIWK
jgi:hypothetical protein